MKICRSSRGPVKHNQVRFYIYDETRTLPEEDHSGIDVPPGINRESFLKDFAKAYDHNSRLIYGKAYRHPILSIVTVKKDHSISFEFDNEFTYTIDDLKLMQRKAKSVARRVVFDSLP